MRLDRLRHESKYMAVRHFRETKGWSINWMCRQLGISRSAYYKWLQLIKFIKYAAHLSQEALRTFCKVLCSESCDRGMIRCSSSFQKIFVIDITPAVFLDGPGRNIFGFMVCIQHYLYQNIQFHWYFQLIVLFVQYILFS